MSVGAFAHTLTTLESGDCDPLLVYYAQRNKHT